MWTVYSPSLAMETITIARPEPQDWSWDLAWQLFICEIEFYERTDITLGCPPNKDDLGNVWEKGADGIFTRPCPYGYEGEVKRYCDEERMYREPVYNCTSIVYADIYEQVLRDGVEAGTVTDLEASTENASNGSILLGDMITIIEIMNLVTDTIEKKDYTAEIKRNITDSFIGTMSNIISEGTSTTWKSMIDETGVGANAVLDNVERFLDNSINVNDTMELVKPNLYIKTEPTSCETGTLFPNRSTDKLPEWIEKTRNSIYLRCIDNTNTSSFSGIIYRNVSQILTTRMGPERDDEMLQLNSPVISFTKYPKVEGKLKSPVEITLQIYDNAIGNPICTFWQKGKGSQGYWSTKGCWLHQYNRQDNIVVCKCNHLTSFAVLMSLSPYKAVIEHQLALSIITKVGLITSLVFILLTNVVYCVFWRYVKSVQSIIIMNLSCTLFLANLLFLTGIDRTGNKTVCTTIAVFLHFLYLSVFAIMLAQGFELAYMVLKPIHTQTPGLRFLFAFYGLSILVVATSMGVYKLEGYGNQKMCWLSLETGQIWTFLIPALLVILINLIVMVIVLRIMCGTAFMSKKTSLQRVKSGVWSIFVMMPIMGLTWLFGIFSINEETVAFQYLFAIFNSLQGFFIFIFHCVLNEKVWIAIGKMQTKWLSSRSSTSGIELKS